MAHGPQKYADFANDKLNDELAKTKAPAFCGPMEPVVIS